jgi:hypothetical protein
MDAATGMLVQSLHGGGLVAQASATHRRNPIQEIDARMTTGEIGEPFARV